jgi:hypothetical protein
MPSRLKCRPRKGLSPVSLGACAVLSLGSALLAGHASAAPAATGRSAAAGTAANAAAERQADLVTDEDQRLTVALVPSQPDPAHPAALVVPYRKKSSNTLVLTRRRAPYTFDDLRKLGSDMLVSQPGGAYLLREHVIVAAGATLSITPSRPLTLRLSSGPEGFVSLVSLGGRLKLNGTTTAPITVESWDESHGRQDTKLADGRAYVRASGQLQVKHTTFARLGFWSGRTGGVSVVGSGISKTVDASGLAATPQTKKGGSKQSDVVPAGQLPDGSQEDAETLNTSISASTMTGNAFGLYITGTSGPRIVDTVIRRSVVDGLVLHRDVDSAQISNVTVDKSGIDGVVVSRDVEGSVLTQLLVEHSGRDGIVLAGSPLADGPSASGSSTRAFGNNVLTTSQSIDNTRIGVHVIGGTAIRVQGNTVRGGRSGIVVSDGATDVSVSSNTVSAAASNGFQVRESGRVTLTGNSVSDSPTGFHLRNAVGTLRDNSTSGVTLHGITFVGDVAGSIADRNRLAGSGTSAIDVVRTASHQGPSVRTNDQSGWSRTVTKDSLVSVLLHPLTLIWLVVAVLLAGMSRPRRGGGALPYSGAPLVRSPNAISMPLPPRPTSSPSPVELSGERESRVYAIPDRRTPDSPTPRPGVTVRRPAAQQQWETAPQQQWEAPAPQQPWETAARWSDEQQWQTAPAPRMPVQQPVHGSDGNDVIDLAIREARLNPATPRRRRAVGR